MLAKPIMSICFMLLFFADAKTQNLVDRLNKGVEAHKQFNLLACDTILANVLSKKDKLSTAQYGEGFYFYSRNLFRIATEEGNGKTGFANTNIQLKIFRAYKAFLELESAEIPRWSEKAAPEIQGMFETLLKASVQCLEAYVAEPKNASFYSSLTQGYLNLAISIKSENYAPFELFGQLYYLEQDFEKAKTFFELAIEKYESKRVLMADNIRMPIVYYSSALLCLDQKPLKAYFLAKKGYAVNELEWKTIGANASKLSPNVVLDNKAVYFNNQYTLGLLELELCLNANINKDSALVLFTERDRYYQEEYSFHFNYATLLEDINPRDASMHYQKAIDLEPNLFEAHFKMASLYFKMGYYYLDMAKIEKGKAKEHTEKAQQLLNTGLPYMQKAIEIDAKNEVALNLIIQALYDLDNKNLLDYYKNLLSELKKG